MNKLTIEECILSPELNGGEGWITYSEEEGHTISGVVILTMEEYHNSKPSIWDHTSFDVQRCVRNNTMDNTMNESDIKIALKGLEEINAAFGQSNNRMAGILNNAIATLKAELHIVWKPSEGDLGWMLSAAGIVAESTNLTYSKSAYTQGSLSETEQEALQERDLRAATKRVLDRVRELEQGEAVDWGNYGQVRFTYTFSHDADGKIEIVEASWQSKPDKYYSTDEAAMEQVAKEMPDDVKLMIGVEL